MPTSPFSREPEASAGPYQAPAAADGDLASRLPDGVALDMTTCFPPPSGRLDRLRQDQRLKLLEQIAPVLRAALHPGEIVRYAAHLRDRRLIGFFAAGYFSALVDRSAVVVTDERILSIVVDWTGRPTHSLRQVVLKTAFVRSSRLLGRLSLQLGRGRLLLGGAPGDAAAIEKLLPPPNRTLTGGVEPLCPACFAPCAQEAEACACGTRFAPIRKLVVASALVPGLGLFMLRMWGLGLIQLLRTSLLVAIGIALALSAQSGALALAAFFIVLGHALNLGVTWSYGRRGLVAPSAALPAPRRS